VSAGPPRVLVAGGGTGGHVFPALALADALRALATVDVVFAGTARGLEASIVPERGYPLELLDVVPMKGGGTLRAAKGAAIAARATLHALRLVRKIAPRVVVSIGGYASGPVSLAASLLGVPLVLVEPNSVVGLANRILSPFAKRAYVAFDETAARFPTSKARRLGVPLRRGFVPHEYEPTATARVLVLGGSRGAQAINHCVPLAAARLATSIAALEVVHQAGKDDVDLVREAYALAGVARATVTRFIDDVAERIAWADVVVARSGASTVAEIAAVGRAAVFIPFPHAADDHQARNALAAARAGGAVCVRQEAATEARVAHEIEVLLMDPEARTVMASRARAFGRPSAAVDIARDILDLVGLDSQTAEAEGPQSPKERERAGTHRFSYGDLSFAVAPFLPPARDGTS
jgi:UDP-N-acetylglucosamine--N-acetylmuramyl-(pentapeptide) pyrophosphoryl-undecaprenol N-acetylglucosamine transferase